MRLSKPSQKTLAAVALFASATTAWALWPEEPSLLALALMLLFCLACSAWVSASTLTYVTISFVVSTAAAFLVYHALAPVGTFVTDYQGPETGATDSQFLLYYAQEYARTFSNAALVTTWGSVAPVFYGGVLLRIFDGAYLGIVLVNSVLYAAAVVIAWRILAPEACGFSRACVAACLLPVQFFYNSMLAKEPIYLFLCCLALWLIAQLERTGHLIVRLFLLLSVLGLLLFFRPAGAVILGLVALWVLYRCGNRREVLLFAAGATAATVLVIGAAAATGYRIPFFFLSDEGSFDATAQFQNQILYAQGRAQGGLLESLVTPPLSLILSPLLALIWLVAPFPIMGPVLESAGRIWSDEYKFSDLAVVVRGLESLLIVALLAVLVWKRIPLRELAREVLLQPVVLFATLSTLGIATFQLLESGRHRYSVTPFLLLFVFALLHQQKVEAK